MNQWFFRSGTPIPPLRGCWQLTCLRTTESYLERNHCSASCSFLGWGSTQNDKRSRGRRRTPPLCTFKDGRLRSQVATWASILAWTSDKSRSSWRPGPNHTPMRQTGPSLHQKGPGRGTPPLQAPSRKPSVLSKLILVLLSARTSQTSSSQPSFQISRQEPIVNSIEGIGMI